MASKEEDNKPRVNCNVNIDREVNIISVYKRLEYVLNNKTESFPNKVESLIQVWKQVSQCRLPEHKQYVVHLMDWLKLHTLNIVLTGDWKKFKDVYEERLLKEVKHCEMLLLHSNNIFSLRCRKLAEVIKDPWGSPILNKLLNNSDVTVGPEEIEFFCMETGYLISTRLRKLCESHCEDLALNLVTTFMRCHQMAEVQHFSLNATDDQKRFILDVYIALLYKYKKTSLIISTLKSLSLQEGLDLLKRFSHKRVNISKIWRHSNRIAHLAAQVYVTATVMKPPVESVAILEGLLEAWLSLNETNDNLDSLMSAIRRIIQAADSAVHMYIFCEVFHKKFGPNMKTFTIELYIRALTTDMNDLEQQKNEDDTVKVVETSKRLAYGFLRLADVLEEHVKVSRECVLTSFSLQPTQATLDKIVKLAEQSGYEVLDTGQKWKCKLHPPALPSDEVCWKCDLCGEFMSQPELQSNRNTNTALNEALTAEQLGLGRQLCDDLVVVLSSPRYQLLNWLVCWQDLHRLCVLYLNDPERTKNLVTELKFLDIDYSIFMGMKREPEDEELTGIERGYEHYLEEELYPEERISPSSEDSASQDSRHCTLGSDGLGENPNMFPPPAAKSDPNVLKSLRLFRPSLKRTKPNQMEDELPPKVFVTSEPISPLTTAQTTTSVAHHSNFSTRMDNHFLVPASNYVARYSSKLNNLLSAQPRPYGSANTENWRMLGQSSSAVHPDEPLNFTVNQSSNRAYAPQEANFLNNVNTPYNFLVGNSNLQQDEYSDVNNSQLDNFKATALNLTMNHLMQDRTIEKAEEHPKCSLELTKDDTKYQKEATNLSVQPHEGITKLDDSGSFGKHTKNSRLENSLEKFQINTKETSLVTTNQKHEADSNCNRNSNLENFLLDHKTSDSPEKYSECNLELQNNDFKTTPECSETVPEAPAKAKESVPIDANCAMIIPYVNKSKNILPSVNNDNKGGEGNCHPISTFSVSKNVLPKPGSSSEEKREYVCQVVPIPSADTSYNISSINDDAKREGSNCHADDSKNVTSASSATENKESHCSTALPIAYVDMSKNVLTIASSGTTHGGNHCLQNNTTNSNSRSTTNSNSKSTTNPNSKSTTSSSSKSTTNCNSKSTTNSNSKSTTNSNSKSTTNSNSKSTANPNSKSPLSAKARLKLLHAKMIELLRLRHLEKVQGTSSENSLVRIDYSKNFNEIKNYNKNYDDQAKYRDGAIMTQRKTDVVRTQRSIDLFKKYRLKEARVVLHRIALADYFKNKHSLASEFVKPRLPKQGRQKKVTKKSENKIKEKLKGKSNIARKNKNGSKPWPLQDINPKVNRRREIKSHIPKKDKCKSDFKADTKNMNPRVVLKRLELDSKDKKRMATSVLANIPGLNDLQMIRPSSVDRIVQVVQVPGARCTTSVPIQSTQTSTQVTPHIQRIGQPRTEKPEPSDPDSTSTSTATATSSTVTTTTSESSTLINILSQQIIRPGNQNNCMSVRPRTSPLINILSQQIIKPATSVSSSAKVSSSSGSTEVQVNSIPRVIAGGEQILSQLINPVRAPAPTLKTLVSAPTSDQNRIVQFICKSSDGKLIPVTSFTSNKVVKVSMTQTVSSSVAGNTSTDESYAKLPQTTCKTKTESAENSDTLPKFQQAFGKPAYQNNIDSAECVTTNSDTVSADVEKSGSAVKAQSKNSSASLNVQPVQGGVIYTRQMPVGQTINLIPPGRGQVFRIATSNAEQLSLVKDTVIHGKMSALLAAALQGKQRTLDNSEIDITSEESSQANTRVAVTTRPTLVQNARIVKPVLQIPSNVIRSTPQSNLSSTTLEQLREFDMVYKQVKERSSTSAPTESSPQSDSNEPTQQISVTYLNQGQKINCAPVVVVSSYCNVQPAASPSLSVTSQGSSSPCVTPAPTLALSSKTATKSPKSKSVKSATTHTTKASPIPKPQQKPQEDEHTTQRIFDILAEYAEQLRNSPDLNNKPAPRRRSNPPTNPNQNAKRKKSSSSKKTGHCSNSLASDGDVEDTHTVGSEDSSCGVVQISVQEEEQPLTTVSASETSETSVSPKQLILTDSTPNQSRSLIIADSNVGEALKMSNTAVLVPGNYIMPVSMVKGGQQIAVVSGGSKILATVPARSGPNMLLFQSFLNQTRIARNLSSITTQAPAATPPTSQNLTAVTLAQTVSLQKVNQLDRTDINSFDTELLLTIAHPPENKTVADQQQTDHRRIATSSDNVQSIRVGDAILNSDNSPEKSFPYEDKSLANASVATSVIAQSIRIKEESDEQPSAAQTIMALNLNSSDSDKDSTIKVEGRVQSVLVATGTSNGPMLSHSPPVYSKQTDSTNSISESNKDEYLRNEGKRNSAEPKTLQSSVYAYQGKIKKTQVGSQRLDRELQQLSLQRKQAALERELRLQKSLSEECEDLGVDEPSTSDLFPEADLLFDSNHSPSFDQTSQDLVKRAPNVQEVKEETKTIGLFCDDEPMRTDFLFEPIEYQSTAVELEYDRTRDMTNGQGSTSNESGLSCEDNTLLQTCTSMSDVTIPSPISPDPYADNSPPPLNKCKYKYSNRKKAERSKQVENWPMELSSSEDTTGSTELTKSCSRSPELYPGKRNQSLSCDEELYGFAIVERLPLKDEEECEEVHCEEVVDCPSGRGARRSVKKLCSCCNGSAKVARKRPASRPPTPFSHKKTVIAKKR